MAEDRVQRRLAAILAADVVGYSRLMEQDEAGTLGALKARRKEVLEPLVARHQGRIFKVTGDGVLVEFGSAVNAVQCAVDLQHEIAAANGDEPEDRHIILRIGVNLGDVIVEGSDLYGDGVNIAARLEALADPGGILVSGTAYDHLKSKVRAGFDDLGAQTLKNIAEPVRAYRFVGWPTVAVSPPRRGTTKPSIAVLPFVNMSDDPEQQYFSDGVTEDIITELSRFRELLVIARNSSFQYRDKHVDVKRMGRELGVRYIVEGSIRKAGDRVRVTAQLVETSNGSHLWAERYHHDMHDIFALQDELAHAVASAVGSRVEAAGRERTVRLSPAGLESYDLVLRANASRLRFSRNDNEEARALLQRAVKIDPTSSQAHAYYAHVCFMSYIADWATDRNRALEEALVAAKRAVTLDNTDTTAHWVLGLLYLHMRSFADARVHVEKAVHLNPNDIQAIGHYGWFLTCVGEADKAIELFEIARRRDPLDPSWIPWLMGIAYFTAHRYDQAIATLSQIHEPINEVRAWLAASYAQAGRFAEARVALEEFLQVAQNDMTKFPGRSLKDWNEHLHGIVEYRDQHDFEHLSDGLYKAGLGE
jgi:TolB-like protein/class 3 adenylate cyclase/Tfp pilus assembly protein PilF